MSAQFEQQKPFLTMEAYLSAEHDSEIKHEYVDGELFAMAGASDAHNRISMNAAALIFNHIREKQLQCITYANDMKVKITDKKAFYPDVMVVCHQDNENAYYKTAPKLIIEVLSKSTRQRDKMLKRLSYQNIPSMEEYAVIEQERCEVEVFRKKDGWQSSFYYLGDPIYFDSIGLITTVADLYYQVENQDILEFLENKQTDLLIQFNQ